MRRQIARWLAAALMLLPLITVVGIGDAEAGTTLTGTIRGVVADENGEPLPGVTIIFRSESLVRERAALTDADGNFFVPGLAPGFYTVVAQLDGFQTVQQNTEVIVDETTRLDFALSAGQITETVTVVATKPVVDKTATDTGVVLDKKFTENIPTARSYQSLLQFAPGVTGGSNPNMLGGTSNSNTYQVDGVSITDSVTGTFGANINFDTIEAVDVKLSGVSAEYGGFQGGLSNVITKSGGNDFTGSIRDEIDSPSFETTYDSGSQDEFAPNSATYTRPSIPSAQDKQLTHDIQGAFGGPIVRDSAWFYVSYSRDDTVGVQFLGNPTGGVAGDGQYLRTFQGDNSLGKLTWQVVNNHKLQYTYSEDPASVPRCYGQLFWGGPCYDSFNVDFQNQGGFFWTGNWNGIWGNRALSDLKISHWENGFLLGPLTPPPIADLTDVIFESPGGLGSGLAAGPAATIDLETGVLYDGTVFDATPSQRLRDQYEAKGTFFFDTGLGSHTLKVGADYQEQTRVGSSIISGNALIYLADINGDGTGFVNATPADGGTGDPYDVNNREYFLWLDFAPAGTGGPTTETTAIYLQDDWQLNENWSFNLGLRFEQNDNSNDIGEAVIDDQGIAPRLGAAFDVTGEGKYVVKATAGRYLDGIELTTLSPFVRAAGGQSAYDFYLNVGGAGVPDWFLLSQVRPDSESSGFSSDLKPQYIDEVTVGYEHSLTPTVGLGIRGVFREWNDIIGQSFTYDYSTGTARQILFFDNRDYLERDYNAVIFTAEKRFANNWELLANYTYAESNGNITTDSGFSSFGNYTCDPSAAGCTADGFVPQAVVNRDGELAWSINNSANIQGSYRIPLPSRRHTLTVGGRWNFRDGNRYSQTDSLSTVVGPGADGVQDNPIGTTDPANSLDQEASITTYYEERGVRREPNVWRLDTSVRWLFNFNRKVNFEGRFEVFNITNEQRPTSVNTGFTLGGNNERFGFPTSYQQFQTPRNYRFNFAVLW
jgi:outer membrane receptor protein involved in Fe transport